MKSKEITNAIEKLRKVGITQYTIEVYVDSEGGESIKLTIYNKVNELSGLETHRLICKTLGLDSRKIEKQKPWESQIYYHSKYDNFSINGPSNQCKIIDYKEEIVPAKPEQIIPAQEQTVKKIAIYDCCDMPEIREEGKIAVAS